MSRATKEVFAERLREQRTGCGLTEAELAESASVSENTIRSCEKGTANPQMSTIVSLAEVLQVPIGDFFVDTEAQANKPTRGDWRGFRKTLKDAFSVCTSRALVKTVKEDLIKLVEHAASNRLREIRRKEE